MLWTKTGRACGSHSGTQIASFLTAARQTESMAERALGELFDKGHIFFVRRDGDWPPADQVAETLDPKAVGEAITGVSWRSIPPADTSVWFAGTKEGERALRNHWRTSTPRKDSEP